MKIIGQERGTGKVLRMGEERGVGGGWEMCHGMLRRCLFPSDSLAWREGGRPSFPSWSNGGKMTPSSETKRTMREKGSSTRREKRRRN